MIFNGETVYYASADSIKATLDYDFGQEKAFKYKGLTKKETAEHIAVFTSSLWQIHAFGEGNTRTTAVFMIKYLRTLGFDVTNDIFKDNSWYFRNALVRSNYSDHSTGVYQTNKYLDRFFGNLMLGENNVLKNRELLVKVNENKASGKASNKASDKLQNLTDTEGAVMKYLFEHPNTTQIEMADAITVSRSSVQRAILSLKEKGLIEREGSKKTGRWIVKKRPCNMQYICL